jgi:hypothetical protein
MDTATTDIGQPLPRFRCTSCTYGTSCRMAPERCPMCGGGVWELVIETPVPRDRDAPLWRDRSYENLWRP